MANKYLELNTLGVLNEKEALTTSVGAGDAGKVVATNSTGRIDVSLMPVGFAADMKLIPCSENLAVGDIVNVWFDEGVVKCRKADASSSNATKFASGFVLAATNSGEVASVYFEGMILGLSGLTPGATQFLSNTTPGGLLETPPTATGHFVQVIGTAISATEVSYEAAGPIIRG